MAYLSWNIEGVHLSESGTIAAFRGEKGVSQLDEKGNVFNKRKNLEFQMLAAVYHKGDHGQYCYTLK